MQKLGVYILVLATISFWGGSYVAGRLLSPGLDTGVLSFVRIVIAFITLMCLCMINGVKLLPSDKRLIWLFFALGVMGIFVYTWFFHLGIRTVPGGRAAVLINTNPMMIAIGAALFMHEKLTPLKIIGILLAALGAAVVISHGHLGSLFAGGFSVGDIWLLTGAAFNAAFALLGKVMMQKGFRPIQIITWAVFFGMLCFIPVALLSGNLSQVAVYTTTDWLCIFYLGAISTALAFVLFYKILHKLGVTGGGVIASMIPIPAIIFVSLFLREPLTASLAVGAAITVTGVLLVNLAGKGSAASGH